MGLDEILKQIAIEEAPPGLIDRWKMNLWARQQVRKKSSLWGYIVLPIVFAGIFYYLSVFNIINISGYLRRFNLERGHEFFEDLFSLINAIPYYGSFFFSSIMVSLVIVSCTLLWYFRLESGMGRYSLSTQRF